MSNQTTLTVVYFAVIIGLFYFLFIRPQAKRQREASALIASLIVGDRVMTAAGIIGTIRNLDGETVELEIAAGVVVEMAKAAVVKRVEA